MVDDNRFAESANKLEETEGDADSEPNPEFDEPSDNSADGSSESDTDSDSSSNSQERVQWTQRMPKDEAARVEKAMKRFQLPSRNATVNFMLQLQLDDWGIEEAEEIDD